MGTPRQDHGSLQETTGEHQGPRGSREPLEDSQAPARGTPGEHSNETLQGYLETLFEGISSGIPEEVSPRCFRAFLWTTLPAVCSEDTLRKALSTPLADSCDSLGKILQTYPKKSLEASWTSSKSLSTLFSGTSQPTQ